jgi:glycosyltransferase involved in cell wall biosynthesis
MNKFNDKKDKYILMVTNVYFPVIGGISTYIRDLSEGLIEKGWRTEITAFPMKWSQFNRIVRWALYIFFIMKVLFKVAQLRKEGISPFVHSHSASFCLLSAVMSKWMFACHTLHTFHSPIDRNSWILTKFTPFLDKVIYVSEATRNLYRKFSVPIHLNEAIIPGGIKVSKFKMPDFETRFSTYPLKILFVGRICKEKGVRELIEAVQLMNNEAMIEIVGAAQASEQIKYRDNLINMVNASDILKRRVNILGTLTGEPLQQLYEQASIFVCPSVWEEPAAIVIAEAMAAGVPVVAFDTGGLRERIHHDKDGLIVPKGDIAALARTLDEMITNIEKQKLMGTAARRRSEKDFDRSIMIQKYIDLYG